jgi:hypothetical protein
MAITDIKRDQGLNVNLVRITSTNTLVEVAAANYITEQTDNITAINNGEWTWLASDEMLVYASDGHGFFEFDGDDFTTLIPQPAGNGNVTLPVVDGDFTVFDGTLGGLKDAGYSASDPAKTKVVMAGSAVVVNHIAKFVDTAGTIDDTAGAAINSGNIQAGLSGTAGTLISFPAVAANGSFIWAAVGNAGNFNATLSPLSTLGQASVYTLPDPGNALARVLVGASATPFVSGEFPVASGTGGLMVSSGLAAADIQDSTNIVAATTADIGGGGAGPIGVLVAGATTASVVVATVESSSNPVSVIACTATGTGFNITFSGDPGVACLVNYILFKVAQ